MIGQDHPENLVPHPRFGDRSVPSGFQVPMELIRTYWRYDFYDDQHLFPGSVIRANLSRQNYTVVPIRYYVDLKKECRKCGRDFIFFAREQQYWYEELGFKIDADCVHCTECRRSNHRLRQVVMRFSRAMSKSENEIGDEELARLVEDAVYLFKAGLLKKEQKLRRLKNLAKARIPESDACRAIVSFIEEIQAGRDATA